MKVGSLVVCVDDKDIRVARPLVKGKIYTVREIHDTIDVSGNKTGGKGLLLEEVVNNNFFDGSERGYKIERFRELDTPTSISIEEILEEPVYA